MTNKEKLSKKKLSPELLYTIQSTMESVRDEIDDYEKKQKIKYRPWYIRFFAKLIEPIPFFIVGITITIIIIFFLGGFE